ncbi:hypothetical protein GRZ55_11605 [Chelativorans sp. ZYF759]|uniref:hypothetical protein n=1 Tax=Chelativorans sp. ZYF759 TaxID=2692213 RepID=UPI00145EF9A4|nr:hypothetical protein [Chelativorans sp. ZYF759]NMG39889.1 hypothetical protein [Chelativorans sp. ZYF759]
MIEMLFVGGCVATAAMFPLEIENVRREGDRTITLVRAENRSDCAIDRIMFECTYRNEAGEALTLARGRVRLLAPGTAGYDEVPMTMVGLHSVSCRPTTVQDAP